MDNHNLPLKTVNSYKWFQINKLMDVLFIKYQK